MSRHLKVPKLLIDNFQGAYIREFPGFLKWWQWVEQTIGRTQSITTFLGRERTFFGRPNDPKTIREAIAYEPQSTVGDIVNEGGYRVWKEFPDAQVLGQYHDAYAFQVPVHLVNDLVPKMIKTFEVEIKTKGRTLVIPGEAKIGYNWAPNEEQKPIEKRMFRDGNPDGLTKWKGSFNRPRIEAAETSVLDRVFY
jgi:DNA polymerase I-like protein with 3'-5' exonuclease and polymerase domains